MRSPIRAILWEQWRLTRATILFALLCTAGVAASLYVADLRFHFAHSSLDDSVPVLISNVAFAISLILMTLYLVFVRNSGNDLSLGFPRQQAILPLRRGILVGTLLAYRVAVVGLVGMVLGCLLHLLYGDESAPYYLGALIALCCLAYLLAISWTVGGRSTGLAVTIMAMFAIPAAMSLRVVMHYCLERSPYLAIGVAVALYCGVLGIAAWGALGERAAWPPVSTLISSCGAWLSPARTRRLTSPEQGQFWYEWRRRGLILPFCTLCVICLLSLIIFPAILSDSVLWHIPTPSSTIAHAVHPVAYTLAMMAVSILTFAPWSLVLASAITGAIFMLMDHRDFQKGSGALDKLKPVPSRVLTTARLRMGVWSVALAYGIVILAVLGSTVTLYALHGTAIVGEVYAQVCSVADQYGVVWMALFTIGYVLLTWVLLWIPLPLLTFAGWFILIIVPVSVFTDLGWRQANGILMAFILWIPALAVAATSVWCGLRTYRRNLLPRSSMWLVGLLVVVAVVIGTYPDAHQPALPSSKTIWDILTYLLLISGLASLPALAVFGQAVWVDRLRYHR